MATRLPMIRPSEKMLLAAILGLCLAGCSDMGDLSNNEPVIIGQMLVHAIEGIGSSSSLPRDRVAAVPYATLGVSLGSSDESLFVLGTRVGRDLIWRGGPQLAITTRNGRIVRTAGFVHNLSGFEVETGSPTGGPTGRTYLYDFADQSRYGIAISCTPLNLGSERLKIIGVAVDTSHLAEDCSAPQLGWNFRNEFWQDANGFVWKSKQYVIPELDPFTIEVLRRAE